MLDRYVHGVVERVSPEAPVLVLREERVNEALGGAGNVLANVVSLGGEASFATVIGPDEAGKRVKALAFDACRFAQVLVHPARPTTVKERHVASGQQLLRVDRESTEPIDSLRLRSLCACVERFAKDCPVVVLSDYGKGALSLDRASEVIEAVRRGSRGSYVIVDPSGSDATRYVGADLIKPNHRELELLTGVRVEDLEDAAEAAHVLMFRTGGASVLATLGADGMLLLDGATSRHFPAASTDVVDVTGAGDTVAAALAVRIASGRSIEEAVSFALGAASVAVSSRGTVAVRYEEAAYRARTMRELDEARAAD